ncbi:MAG: PIN domain-containing protein [Candidatus Gracilibacteria bacterium]|nr:PIN domain-containing protein [Candidatus Gracilibacteria bacterium]
MKILDSNVWIALFNKEDSLNKKASDIMKELVKNNEKIFITEYLILEISTILLLKNGKKLADNFINFVYDNSDIDIIYSDKYFFENTIQFFTKNNYEKLSFVDQSLLLLSKSYQIITFDKELNRFMKK